MAIGGHLLRRSGELHPGEATSLSDVSRFIALRGLSLLGDQAVTYAIPVAVYLRTGRADAAGALFLVQWGPRVALTPVFGAVADRFSARAQLLVDDLGRAFFLCMLAVVTNTAGIIAIAAVLTLLSGHSALVTERYVARRADTDVMPRAQARQQATFQTALIAGPALGTALLGTLALPITAATLAGIFAIAAGGTCYELRTERGKSGTDGSVTLPVRAGLRLGFSEILTKPHLRQLLALTLVLNLVGALALVTLPLILIGRFAASEGSVGVTATAAAIAALSAAIVVDRRNANPRGIWKGAVPLLSLGAVLMATSYNPVFFAAGFASWSAGISVYTIWMRTRRLQLISADLVGVSIGFFVTAVLAATPVAGLIVLVAGDKVAPQILLLGASAFTLLMVLSLVGPSWIRSRHS